MIDDKTLDALLDEMTLDTLKKYAKIGLLTSYNVLQKVLKIFKEKDDV